LPVSLRLIAKNGSIVAGCGDQFMDRLLAACLRGDPHAWEQFVDHYAAGIVATVRRVSNQWTASNSQIEDLT